MTAKERQALREKRMLGLLSANQIEKIGEAHVGFNWTLEECAIGLYRDKGPRVGTENNPAAPLLVGYALRAELSTSKEALLKKHTLTDGVSYPLPDAKANESLDKWKDINLNPTLVRKAITTLCESACAMGFQKVSVWDFSGRNPVLKSTRSLRGLVK
jgi:hypothetical protein